MIRARTPLRFVPFLALFGGCIGAANDTPRAPTDSVSVARESAPALPARETAPPPRELVYLEITPAAAREIKAHVADLKLERWWLRLTLKPGGCSGFQNKLDLDGGPLTKQDFEFVADGVPVVVVKSQRQLVQGTRIDFVQKDGTRGFTVTNPNASAGTREALAKWINDEFNKRNSEFAPLPDATQTQNTDRAETPRKP